MPTAVHADREEPLLFQPAEPPPATPEDTSLHDLGELCDLGGSD